MKIEKILEGRKHPDKNPKITVNQFLDKFRGNKSYYCHWSAVPKVGINPKTKDIQDTPHGVYAQNMFDLGEESPAYGFLDKGFWFILESDVPYVQDYTTEKFESDLEQLKDWYGDGNVERVVRATKSHFSSTQPIANIYVITRMLTGRNKGRSFDDTNPDIKAWATLLRRLGITYVIDHGEGFIHGAEMNQVVFLGDLTEASFQYKIIDMFGIYAPRKVTITHSDSLLSYSLKQFSETHVKRLKFDSENAFRNSNFLYDSRFLKSLILNFKLDRMTFAHIMADVGANARFNISIKALAFNSYTYTVSDLLRLDKFPNVTVQHVSFSTIDEHGVESLPHVKFPKNIGEILFYNTGMLEIPKGTDPRVKFIEDGEDEKTPLDRKPSFGELVDASK